MKYALIVLAVIAAVLIMAVVIMLGVVHHMEKTARSLKVLGTTVSWDKTRIPGLYQETFAYTSHGVPMTEMPPQAPAFRHGVKAAGK